MSSYLYGDWEELKRRVRGLSDNNSSYKDAVRNVGDGIAEKIRSYIESQALDFAPLQEEYLAAKVSQGGDPRILIRSGAYAESIKTVRDEERAMDLFMFISIEGGTTETGISMQELAEYIEYGTSRQPARLPITQSWEQMKNDVQREIGSVIKGIIAGDIN